MFSCTGNNNIVNVINYENVQFQKISILATQKGLEFPGGGGVWKTKSLKKCMKLALIFQRGEKVLENVLSIGEVWMFS